jgi:hypothetical protein
MQSGNLYGLIIAILSLAVTIVLTIKNVRENGFRLEIIVQPAPSYAPRGRTEGQQAGFQSELIGTRKVARPAQQG